jgi:hypothetical protein
MEYGHYYVTVASKFLPVAVIFIYWAGVETSPLTLRSFIGLSCRPWMVDGDDCVAISGMNEG